MAHFAELIGNDVVRVLVVNNSDIIDDNGQESEAKGILFLKNLFGMERTWVQTSYNSRFRNKYAGPGDEYVAELDVFREKQPFPSWSFNIAKLQWEAPFPEPESLPDHGNVWIWDEANLTYGQTYFI